MTQNQQYYASDKQILEKWISKLKLSGIKLTTQHRNPTKYLSSPWLITEYDSIHLSSPMSLISNSTISIQPPKLLYNTITIENGTLIHLMQNNEKTPIIIDTSNQSYHENNFHITKHQLIDQFGRIESYKITDYSLDLSKYQYPRILSELNHLKELLSCTGFHDKLTVSIDMDSLEQSLNTTFSNPLYTNINLTAIYMWIQLKLSYMVHKYKNKALNIESTTAVINWDINPKLSRLQNRKYNLDDITDKLFNKYRDLKIIEEQSTKLLKNIPSQRKQKIGDWVKLQILSEILPHKINDYIYQIYQLTNSDLLTYDKTKNKLIFNNITWEKIQYTINKLYTYIYNFEIE